MMIVSIRSIPKEEKGEWAKENDICPRCNEKFGLFKQVKDQDKGKRIIVHKKCSDGSYLK